jgi:hypothetical protein
MNTEGFEWLAASLMQTPAKGVVQIPKVLNVAKTESFERKRKQKYDGKALPPDRKPNLEGIVAELITLVTAPHIKIIKSLFSKRNQNAKNKPK